MKYGPQLDVWVVGFCVGACLAGGVYLAVRFNLGGILNTPPRVSTELPPSPPAPAPPTTFRHRKKIGRPNSSYLKGKYLRGSQAVATELVALENSDSGLLTVPATFRSLHGVASEPERKTLKPLGYVQKAGGVVEAIVSDGDAVRVVHAGETFQEKYTVAQIAPDGVEVVAASVRSTVSPAASTVVSTSNLVNGTSSEAWSYSPPITNHARHPRQNQIAIVSERPGRAIEDKVRAIVGIEPAASTQLRENRQVAQAPPINDSSKPLGYVEKADGTSFSVMSEGDSVRLIKPGDSLAAQSVPKGNWAAELSAQLIEVTGVKKSALGQDINSMQPIPSTHKLSPDVPSTLASVLDMTREPDRPLKTSTILGVVEKADGKLEAIVDDGNGVRLSQVSAPLSLTVLSGDKSARPTEVVEPSLPGTVQPLDRADGVGTRLAAAYSPQGGPLIARGIAALTEDPLQGMDLSKEGRPEPGSSKPPLESEVAVADEKLIPMKPAPDIATVEASFGLVTEAKGSSDRDAAILGSLGFAHLEGDRASPEGMPFESGALPTGPPEPDAEVLRSFGYEDWQYGRGSPIASSLGLKTGAKGPGNPTFLRPLGYVEWQDGHALAVISDGKGGVCLVAKGETLEGGFRVVNIGPEAVEIVELSPDQTSAAPALRLSSSGDVHLDSVEAHPGATPIPKLPLARASSALGLELVRIAQPAKATGTRPGKKAVGRRAQRIALPTPPVAETSPLPPPPEGKVRPQCKNPQPTPINLAPPKARAHRPSGKPHQLDSHAAPPISLRLTSGSAQPLGPPAGFRDSLFSSF